MELKKLYHKKLSYIDPVLVFNQVIDSRPGLIFLDSSSYNENYGRYSYIMFDPLTTYSPTTLIQEAMLNWQQLLHNNKTEYDPHLPPFSGGLAGFLSYDLGKQFESIPSKTKSNVPDYCLGLYNKIFAFDHLEQNCYIFIHEVTGFDLDLAKQFEELLAIYNLARSTSDLLQNIKGKQSDCKNLQNYLPEIQLTSNFTENEYIKIIAKAKEYIFDGDIYEVNLAQRFFAKLSTNYSVNELHNKLRQINPSPFSAYLNLGSLKILSASPERFLSICGNKIEARPIKGTIKRSADPELDQKLAQMLSMNEKDRAENIMIVDLLRNDLGKICVPGSIKVNQLCGVESYAGLHHLVSIINGELKPEIMVSEVIQAAFPGGSITGAPKIRAMQIIEELEGVRRGVYCGSIGYFGFNGNVDLSIAIRTIIVEENNLGAKELSFSVGGAITLDSDPLSEYEETLLKAEKLIEAINGKVSRN